MSSVLTPREAAPILVAGGVSVIPVKSDGSKGPAVQWKTYQQRRPTEDELAKFFVNGHGIAIVAGHVSDDLEVIDIEADAPFNDLCDLINEHAPGLLEDLPRVTTPTGGYHLFYRCDKIGGNQKLASTARGKVLIETRGEGGYVVTITSPPTCHPLGKTYTLVHGRLSQIPRIAAEEREILLSCCRSFNSYVREQSDRKSSTADGKRPGDDYNLRGDVLSVLRKYGWVIAYRRGDSTYLRRPGKAKGISATVGHVAPNTLYVFSSNAQPFEFERAYDAFGVYTRLEPQGDYSAATKELGRQGYGTEHQKQARRKADAEASRPEGAMLLDTAGKAPLGNLNNAVTILEHDPSLEGLVWFDEFLGKLMTGDPPREWTDADDLTLTLHIQRNRGILRLGREIASQAALTVAFRNVKNCVRDWLNSLKWDGEPRIDHFFEDHFGATGTAYTRSASKNFWLSMVARIYKPGCQADNMIVLEGQQGIKKSSALRVIGGQWFAEQHENVTDRSFFEVLQGKLLVEISEMDAFSRAEVTRVKQVITNTSDRFREPYGRHAKDHPRQCIFAGTTNKDDWNRDETGARRFWPITCQGDIDLVGIAANREQFFAEAVQRFRAGESWWEMPSEQTRQQQAARYVAPAWVEPIEKYIEQERMEDDKQQWVRRVEPLTDVSVAEILQYALDVPEAQWNKANEMRVAECLRYLGWTKKDVRRKGRIVKRWVLSLPEGGNGDEGGNG